MDPIEVPQPLHSLSFFHQRGESEERESEEREERERERRESLVYA